MSFKSEDVLNRIARFISEDVIGYRHDLMVRKGYIDKEVEYTDELWETFKEVWFKGLL